VQKDKPKTTPGEQRHKHMLAMKRRTESVAKLAELNKNYIRVTKSRRVK
tara:strand:+ start:82 stop:228 length:147 start_codon:yes stop_codon:yes gene_type:complete